MQARIYRDAGAGDRAVSQVIGIVLLVAIVTMLAGVAAVYMTGFGGDLEGPAPNFATTTEFNDSLDGDGQYLNVTHRAGETLETDDLRLDVDGAESVHANGTRQAADPSDDVIRGQVGDEFTASETLVLNRSSFTDGGSLAPGKNVDLSDAVVRIIYDPGVDEQSHTLYECRPAVPDCEETPA